MKAITLNEHGGPDVLKWAELPTPTPQKNQVLIDLKAAALNHLDIWVRKGIPAYPVSFPHVLGSDGAGFVRGLGPEAEGISEGDRVIVLPALSCGECVYCKKGQDNQCEKFSILGAQEKGTYAQSVLVPDENVLVIPPELSFVEAAAFPLAYLTAWHMLFGRAKISKGETLLVVGASSGVAMAAIQLGKWCKARVLAVTTSEDKIEKIKKAGADEIKFIKPEENFSKWVLNQTEKVGVQVAFEHVGPATWTSCVKSLAPYGRLITCGATTGPTVDMDLRYLFSRDLTLMGSRMGTKKEFQQLSSVIFRGEVKRIVDKTFPLEEASKAHAYLEGKKQTGKVVLTIP